MTTGLCINTLSFIRTQLEQELFKVAPHGATPSGEHVSPDYSNAEASSVLRCIAIVDKFMLLEDTAMDEYYHRMNLVAEGGEYA